MTEWTISTEAAALHRDALVWDMTFPWRDYGAPELKVGALPRMAASGVNFVSLTMAIDSSGLAEAVGKVARERAYFREHADDYVLVESVDDILRAKAEGKLAVGFHFQGTNALAGDLNMVEVYYRLGIRHMLMAYNLKNLVGDGCLEPGNGGLSRFGAAMVQEMNRVGMIVDCAHTSDRTSMDVFEVSADPVMISHSNVRALRELRRNVSDELITACAATGGVIGLNGFGPDLTEGDLSVATLVAHIDHIADLVGPSHIGIGLDYVYDQSRAPTPWHPPDWFVPGPYPDISPEQLPELTEALMTRGYAEAEVRGILGENWLRIAKRVWK